MGLRLITPAAYPLSLEEAKAWVRLDDDASDSVVEMLIGAATQAVQDYIGRAIGPQVWELTLDAFSASIELPVGPVSAVDSVRYDDVDGAEQTVSTDVYSVDLASDPQWIVRNSEESWPATLAAINVVRVRFTTGSDPDYEPLKSIVAALVTRWHDDRDDMTIPPGIKGRLDLYRKIII